MKYKICKDCTYANICKYRFPENKSSTINKLKKAKRNEILDRKCFGTVLRKKREEAGFGRTFMARELGITVKGYTAYENGAVYPSLPVFIAICSILKLENKDFMRGISKC